MSLLAFIGGTGFDLRGPDSQFSNARDERIETRFGAANVTRAVLGEREIVFLHRHARPDDSSKKDVPPHQISYRANIAALKKLGVTAILASTAVGCLRPSWAPGTLVCLDDLLDFTTNRAKTFFDARAVHVDMTRPFSPDLRALLLDCAAKEGIALQNGGVYCCADGPRFETAAEIRAFKTLGADVVGMTGATECFLAREAEISYAGVAIVTNAAAGISPNPLTHHEVLEAMGAALPQVGQLFLAAARVYQDHPESEARCATRGFAVDGYDPQSEII